VMQKMHVQSLPELVRHYDLLESAEQTNTSTKG